MNGVDRVASHWCRMGITVGPNAVDLELEPEEGVTSIKYDDTTVLEVRQFTINDQGEQD